MAEYPNKVILIDFTAVWCGPCKFYGPILEKVQGEFSKYFIFAKVDVDENRQVAMKYQISGVPTTLFIRKGQVLNKVVGAMNYNNLKVFLEKLKDYNH